MIAAAGYDFAVIDMEHSAFDIQTVSDMCEVARAAGVTPIVRPYARDAGLLSRLLDVGAMGLMIPGVSTRDEVQALNKAMLFPPDGERGASIGALYDYRLGPSSDANKDVNANTLLIVQIESTAGVENIDAILDGGGVHIVEVGRNDLARSLGMPGEPRNPVVLDALNKVVSSCRDHGVTVGAGCSSAEDATDLMTRGVRWLMYPNDIKLLMEGFGGAVRMLRSASESAGSGA
jgi:2-dehydro-3-deoxyglucarate aldolase/4-hydroxy-2-oxoheptanedioate aldolase